MTEFKVKRFFRNQREDSMSNKCPVATLLAIAVFSVISFGCSGAKVKPADPMESPQATPALIQVSIASGDSESLNKQEKYQTIFQVIMEKSGFALDFKIPSPSCKGRTKNDLPHGQWNCYSLDGKKVSTAMLAKGRLSGWVRTWYSDGKLESEALWKDSKLNGPAVKFFQNGIREITGKFKNNSLDGLIAERDESNHQVWSAVFENGVLNGRERIFFPNGAIKSRTYYRNGKKSGSYTEWYESGNMRLHGHYSEDRPIGVWILWDGSNGSKSKSGTFDEVTAQDQK
jgi:antitoxin component YwqK of YwqJK toxin-antitoxin module